MFLFHLIAVCRIRCPCHCLPDRVMYSAACMAAFLAQPAEERIMRLPFVCFFCLCFGLCFCFSLIYFYLLSLVYKRYIYPVATKRMCPFLATMSFAGYFLVRCLLSAFLRNCSGFDLVWFCCCFSHSAHWLPTRTTAGFVADQFM